MWRDTDRHQTVKVLNENRTFKKKVEPLKHPIHFNPTQAPKQEETQAPPPAKKNNE